MPHDRFLTFWTRLLAVTFLTTGQVLCADDKPADSADAKIVPIKSGDSTLNVQVKEPIDPYRNVSTSGSSDKYDPAQPNYSSTSPLAHKQFLPSDASISKNDSFLKENAQSTFITKSYFTGATSQTVRAPANLDTEVFLPTTTAYSSNAASLNKSFTTSSFDASQNRTTAFASKTSSDQDRTALPGPQATSTFSSRLASKTYQGPEATAIHRDLTKINENLMGIKDLPNRPLTIDEVRALINHGVKPNTDEKPAPPTKPLNDPDYKPEVSPAPPVSDDDKNDPVPPPGTMAAPPPPEDSEPLPNH